jgi:hypothetical protein
MSGWLPLGFLNDFSLVSEKQVEELERTLDAASVRALLIDFFKIGDSYSDSRKVEIAADFHFYNYAFCKESAFSALKTSTFLTLMYKLMIDDVSVISRHHTVKDSYDSFQSLILRHSVERPPRSVGVFSEKDVSRIHDFVVNSYFRHFLLYKFVFSVQEVFKQPEVKVEEGGGEGEEGTDQME